jgi:thymidylate synthase (FAD)
MTMKIIEQSIQFEEPINGEEILWKLERAARNCYKSEGKNSERDRAKRDALLRHAVKRGHTSVLEHVSLTFRVTTNRGVSHEWVRHRIGWSYSQESTRYCNYGHSEGITVIWPWFLGQQPAKLADGYGGTQLLWVLAMENAERSYLDMLEAGCKPEEARDVLPSALKTEIVCTANIVALRHFFRQRCTRMAHPQIRALALQLLEKLNAEIPILFEDLAEEFLK